MKFPFAAALTALSFATPFMAAPVLAHDTHSHAENTRPADLGIQVHAPYAFAALPQAPTAAAFMVIHNHGTVDDHLLSVSSDVAARTELHDHVMNAEGVAQMVHVAEGFPVAGYDGELVLQRGGAHVMFMGLKQPFTDGMIINLTLHFEKAGDVVVEVPVDLSRMTEDAADGHAGHDMGHDMDHGGDHAGDHGADHEAPAEAATHAH